MRGLSEDDYEKMSKEEKIAWHDKQLAALEDVDYTELAELEDDEGEQECFGMYLQLDAEACEECFLRDECMEEMPPKLDVVLETMGVDLKTHDGKRTGNKTKA